jgi:hypothetical protein
MIEAIGPASPDGFITLYVSQSVFAQLQKAGDNSDFSKQQRAEEYQRLLNLTPDEWTSFCAKGLMVTVNPD